MFVLCRVVLMCISTRSINMHVCCHPSPSCGNTVGDITPLPIAAIFRRIDACNCQQLEHTSMLTCIHPIAHTTSFEYTTSCESCENIPVLPAPPRGWLLQTKTTCFVRNTWSHMRSSGVIKRRYNQAGLPVFCLYDHSQV